MKLHLNSLAQAVGILCIATGAGAAFAGTFPTLLSGNTTGQSAAIFLGAPDDQFVGLGADEVTYDFGLNQIVNRPGLVDINLYEVDFGAAEFTAMDILVSQDGVTFTSIKGSETSLVRTSGDSVHGNNSYGRSYNLGALDWVRYVRIDGKGSGRAGSTNGFDLDAIGAHEVQAAIPEPGTWALMLAGLAAVGGLARRRRT